MAGCLKIKSATKHANAVSEWLFQPVALSLMQWGDKPGGRHTERYGFGIGDWPPQAAGRDTDHAPIAGLRDSKVSFCEADFDHRGVILLPRNILYNRQRLNRGYTGQRAGR